MTQRIATHVPQHRGPAAWNFILGAPPAPRITERDCSADFVIIGAGFAGLAAARRLTQLAPDASVVVLDAGRIAEGAAGRNSGFMIDLPHELTSEDYAGAGDDQAVISLNRQAQSFAKDAVDDYGIDGNFFDPAGKINGAASQHAHLHNQSYAKHLTHLGETWQMLDAKQMAEITGSQHYLSGLYTPGTVMLQPAGFVRGMAAGLQRQNVTIYEDTPVTALRRAAPGWIVETPKATLTAGKVILTVNGHLQSFGFEQNRLMQLFLFAVMTKELSADELRLIGGQPRWGVTPSDPMGTTMRRIDTGQGGNRIIVRTCASLRPGMKASAADMCRAEAVMRRKFDQRFPQAAGMPMDHRWAGHLCLSLNGVAVMRELDQNLFSGCVQNGLGTARGTLTGIAAAELACGESSPITSYFAAEDRPKKLPPRPFQQIGANSILRFREWRAKDD
jgi:glycine/D-amino acid oxidase-like deaminating enzyme